MAVTGAETMIMMMTPLTMSMAVDIVGGISSGHYQ